MSLFGKTGNTIGAVVFAFWVIAPLVSVRAGDCPAMHKITRAAEATAPHFK